MAPNFLIINNLSLDNLIFNRKIDQIQSESLQIEDYLGFINPK